jgi:hypothetical protein
MDDAFSAGARLLKVLGMHAIKVLVRIIVATLRNGALRLGMKTSSEKCLLLSAPWMMESRWRLEGFEHAVCIIRKVGIILVFMNAWTSAIMFGPFHDRVEEGSTWMQGKHYR